MYGEHLNDNSHGFDDGNNADAAPPANYHIEMDHYAGAQAFEDKGAVYLGDANSVELDYNKQVPDMNNFHQRSVSIKDIDSPRDQWAANPNAPDPTKGLNCLWAIIIIVIISCIAAMTTIDNGMVNIFIDMEFEGSFYWNLGWRGAKFNYVKDSSSSNQALAFNSNASEAEKSFPIPNTMLYMQNAGYLLLCTVLVSLLCIAYILMILCSRCNTHILLYVKFCCCRIPQRASVYFAFDVIKSFSWATTMYYIVLGIYGLLETNFYLTSACPSGNTCWSFIVPHYGFFCLMCITFGISCCAFSKVQALDVKFNSKSMQLYYPQNLRKAESRNCELDLDMLFSSIASIKNICILSLIMLASFRQCGLISLVFYNKTLSTGTNAVMFFQFQGLDNTHGFAANSYLDAAEDIYGPNSVTFSTVSPAEDIQSKANGFELAANAMHYCVMFIFLMNFVFVLPYIWFVIIKYSSIGCCKFIIVLSTFILWLVYTICLFLYYYEFNAFFHNYAELQLEYELSELNSGNDFSVVWFPDWGLFVVLLLWFYLLRLMYTAFKGM